jgi:hypothetical protein
MEHDAHLSEDAEKAGPGAKIIAVIVIVAALLGLGAYVVYGSYSQQQQSSN